MISSIPGFSDSGDLWSYLGICLPSKVSRCSTGSGRYGEHRGHGVPTQLSASWLSGKSMACLCFLYEVHNVLRWCCSWTESPGKLWQTFHALSSDVDEPDVQKLCPQGWLYGEVLLAQSQLRNLLFALDKIHPRPGCGTVCSNTVATSTYRCFSLNQ